VGWEFQVSHIWSAQKRPTNALPGLYVPSDPGAPDKLSGKGQVLVSFGKLFEKVSLIPGVET
jgi:hypothetical protein